MSPPPKNANAHGLLLLSTTQSAEWLENHGPSTLDIVAVHGLNGGRWSSWQKGETMWLQDLLPAKVPHTRIMTFGYEASLVGNFSNLGIRDHARKLLSLLRNKRDEGETENRPIVFICHSLGGIVVKQALRTATNEAPYKAIAASTKGIIFMGTPHRGSDIATWGDIISHIAEAAFLSPKKDFIKALKNNSEELKNISEDFRSIVDQYSIVSFYEETRLKIVNKEVVGKHSAVMELPKEEAIPMEGNHMEICKFSVEDDENFEEVWKAILRVSGGRAEHMTSGEIDFLIDLSYFDPEAYLRHSPKALEGTLEWFMENETTVEWLQTEKNPILHVVGKPGCGKSVLSTFVLRNLRALPRWSATCFVSCKEVSTILDLYGSLLRQLLSQMPFLLSRIYPQLQKSSALYRANRQNFANDLDQLCRLINNKPIFLVVDALDECGSFVEDLMKFLIRISDEMQSSRFALFSRPEGYLLSGFSSALRINLNDQSELDKAVELYAEYRVDALIKERKGFITVKSEISNTIRERSAGMFLLVNFIIDSLKGLKMSSASRIRLQLKSFPTTLSDAYRNHLNSVDYLERDWVKRIIVWLLYGLRPLNVSELGYAATLCEDIDSFENLQSEAPLDFERDLERNLGLLLKITRDEVRFSHSTVNEFLKASSRDQSHEFATTEDSDWFRIVEEDGNEILVVECLRYLDLFASSSDVLETMAAKIRDLKPEASQSRIESIIYMIFPLYEYVVANFPDHVRQLSGAKTSAREQVLKFLSSHGTFRCWQMHYWKMHDPEREPAPPLHLACFFGWDAIVSDLLARGSDPRKEDRNHRPPLDYAAEAGNINIIKTLIEYGANPLSFYKEHRSVLSTAAWYGQVEVMDYLIRNGVNPNTCDYTGRTVLMVASESGRESAVSFLLDKGANVNDTEDHRSASALCFAAEFGRQFAVSILLQHGASVRSGVPFPEFHAACLGGKLAVMQEMLRNGATIEDRDVHGATPLHSACARGAKATIEALLELGAAINAIARRDRTPLHVAAESANIDAVRVVLLKGANVQAHDDEGNSALHLALTSIQAFGAQKYHKTRADIAALLIENGLDVEESNLSGKTAVDLALAEDNQPAMELIRPYVKTSVDKDGQTLLHRSVKAGAPTVTEWLLDQKYDDIAEVDKAGQNALHLAAQTRYGSSVLEILLRRSTLALVNKQDSKGMTPLHFSSLSDDMRQLDFLLQAGADPNLRNNENKSSLDVYIEATSIIRHWHWRDFVKLLLRFGAVLQKPDTQPNLEFSGPELEVLWIALDDGYGAFVHEMIGAGKITDNNFINGVNWAIEERSKTVYNAIKNYLPQAELRRILHDTLKSEIYTGLQDQQRNSCIDWILQQPEFELEHRFDGGKTPLILFAERGDDRVVAQLLKMGASVDAKDGAGRSALSCTRDSDVIRVLRSAGQADA